MFLSLALSISPLFFSPSLYFSIFLSLYVSFPLSMSLPFSSLPPCISLSMWFSPSFSQYLFSLPPSISLSIYRYVSLHQSLIICASPPLQVRSECLTCTFRTSCCSVHLSRAQVLAFAGSSVLDRIPLFSPSFYTCFSLVVLILVENNHSQSF